MDRALKRFLASGALALAVALVALPGAARAQTSPGGAALDHFQCYEIRPPGQFDVAGVGVVDQFGATTIALEKAFTLCAPADKNGEDPSAASAPEHLTSYGIRRGAARFARVRGLTVTNQFGSLQLDAVKPARLMVPTAKSLAGPPSSAAGGLLDHFQCYKAKRARGTSRFAKVLGVQVTTQFESATIDLVRPLRLCAPVDKNGESPGAENHPDHLLCYRVRSSNAFSTRRVYLNNQFGQQSYLVSQRREFCVPSLKTVAPTTTTTATVPGTTSTSSSTTPGTSSTSSSSPATSTSTSSTTSPTSSSSSTSASTSSSTSTSSTSTSSTSTSTMPTDESNSQSVTAGGSVTTDTEADGTTTTDPIESTVTTPNAGTVSILETSPGAPPSGYELLSQAVIISAPPATAADPLELVFLVDPSAIRAGESFATVQVFRNGLLVEDCVGAPGVALPDPCVSERVELMDGTVQITVLTSQASTWTFGVTTCGNGILNAGEACDPPGVQAQCGGGQVCKADCTCSAPCACCSLTPGTLKFTSSIGTGNCGTVVQANGVPIPHTNANLACNALYYGTGFASFLQAGPFPDQLTFSMNVASCDPASEELVVAPRTAAETGSNRNCSAAGCLFGPPLPVANPLSTPTSHCLVIRAAQDFSGTATCNGAAKLTLPLAGAIYLTGDLEPAPGIQPCPTCTGVCNSGPNSGLGCTPASTDLGDAYPTSQDCPPSPGLFLHDLTLGATATTDMAKATAANSDGAGGLARVFCGYCRDFNSTNGFGLCVGGANDGDPCAQTSIDCPGGICRNPQPCDSNADCPTDLCDNAITPCHNDNDCVLAGAATCSIDTGARELCQQRDNGAFGSAVSNTITLTGAPAGCLADGLAHAGTLAAGMCVEPTFDGIVDGAIALPGPGAFSLEGVLDIDTLPPTTSTSTSSTSTSTSGPPTTSTSSTTTPSTTSSSVTTTTSPGCCANTQLRFTVGTGVGNCGTVVQANGAPIAGANASLACGNLYIGSGSGGYPSNPMAPAAGGASVSGQTITAITACNPMSGAMTLGPATSGQTGSNESCSAAGCLFGAPVPLTNPTSTPTSTCLINVVSGSGASGSANCVTGVQTVSMPLNGNLYLTGDLEPAAGIQSCPTCQGGLCQSGANSGGNCVPDSSNPGPVPQFPTSHDCPPLGSGFLFPLALPFNLTTGVVTRTAANTDGPGGQARVFCGYCRDVNATLGVGLCLSGVNAGQPCNQTAIDCPGGSCGSEIPCTSNAGCPTDLCDDASTPCHNDNDCVLAGATSCIDTGARELCQQRDNGAFGQFTANTISMSGTAAGSLADGLSHPSTLASVFCLLPSYDGSVDGVLGLPGPGAVSLSGTAQVLP